MPTRIVDTADVNDSASIGDGSSIWHLAQVRDNAVLGANCIVGRGAHIGSGVRMGTNCKMPNYAKMQNYGLVYEPAELGDGVFIGPTLVLTNDTYPRAVTPGGDLKSASDWQAVGVTIGARAVWVAPVTIGAWALVAAVAVVTRDVPAHALVVGVPPRRVGWVGRSGTQLEQEATGSWICPTTGERFRENDGALAPLEDNDVA